MNMVNGVVSDIKEPPTRERKCVKTAHEEHKSRGFTPYDGPKLQGTRFKFKIGNPGYPDVLRHIPRPPEAIYGIGDPNALQEGLAIVGARKATPYGRDLARRFGLLAARKGIVIISGGARGCDSAAHKAALEAGAPTVVFLGGGCDYVYPAENFDLFQQVINTGGAVVSEHEWGWPPLPYAFRERNRLIAGLARATLVVEAGMPSGTFSTADEALGASREVLAVPGAITSKMSRGTNTLILQGATPVIDDDSFEDALFSIFGCLRQQIVAADGREVRDGVVEGMEETGPIDVRQVVLEAVAARPTGLDELCGLINFAAGGENPFTRVAQLLEELARERLVVRLPDGRYVARAV